MKLFNNSKYHYFFYFAFIISLLFLGISIFRFIHLKNFEKYTYSDENYEVIFKFPDSFFAPNKNHHATPHIIQNNFENNFGINFYFQAANFEDRLKQGTCPFKEKSELDIIRDFDGSDLRYTAEFTDPDQCQYYILSISYLASTHQDLVDQLKTSIESFTVKKINYAQQVNLNNGLEERNLVNESIDIDRFVRSYSCFDFIHGNAFVDPSTTLPISNSELLKNLAEDWSWGKICGSLDTKHFFVVSVNKTISNQEEKERLFEETLEIYPSLEGLVSLESDLEQYQLFVLVNRPLEITSGSLQKKFEPNQLYPLAEFAYSGVLAGCTIEPGNYASDGLVLSCGFGDNGCATVERVKWNILTGESEYLNICTNNCDLAEDEPSTLICQ